MTNYTIGFEGTVTEQEALDVLEGYCTVLRMFTDFGTFIAKVQTDNPERLERHLTLSGAVDQFLKGGD
jgi:hypothetical protein